MALIFPKWTNEIPKALPPLATVGGAVAIFVVWFWFSPKHTDVGYQPHQPIPAPAAIPDGTPQEMVEPRHVVGRMAAVLHRPADLPGQLRRDPFVRVDEQHPGRSGLLLGPVALLVEPVQRAFEDPSEPKERGRQWPGPLESAAQQDHGRAAIESIRGLVFHYHRNIVQDVLLRGAVHE